MDEPEHTIAVDDAILHGDQNDPEAWLQKSQALLALNRLVEAEHALTRAVELNPNQEQASKQLNVLEEALRLDSSLHDLSRSERAKRAVESLQTAWKRLNTCAAQQGVTLAPASPDASIATVATPSPLQLLYDSGLQRQTTATEKNLREDPDAMDSTIQYVFEVERSTAPICPEMDLSDRALLMLAKHEAAK